MKIRTNRDNLDRVEHDMRPAHRSMITIPLDVEGLPPRKIAVYITTSAFDLEPLDDAILCRVAHEIAVRIDECEGD